MSTYADLEEYKAEIKEESDDFDAVHARDLLEASRVFDRLCGAPVDYFAAATATKLFDVDSSAKLWIPPLQTVTTLKTDDDGDGVYEVTWAVTDYRLYPLAGPPYTEIRVHDTTGRYRFPRGDARAQIVGVWGEVATGAPRPVQKAVRLLANRYRVRPNTPEALLAGTENMMALGEMDPDVKLIIEKGKYMVGGFFA